MYGFGCIWKLKDECIVEKSEALRVENKYTAVEVQEKGIQILCVKVVVQFHVFL